MNDLLKQRIMRALDTLPDDRAYQVLDFVEFLESRYAERQRPTGFPARIVSSTVTMGLMDSATKVMKGLAAAGQAVVDEAISVAQAPPSRPAPPAPKPPEKLEPPRESAS